jgi:endonuclease V-like protein UPF0215 family
LFEVLVLTFEPTRNRSNGDLHILLGKRFVSSRVIQELNKKEARKDWQDLKSVTEEESSIYRQIYIVQTILSYILKSSLTSHISVLAIFS